MDNRLGSKPIFDVTHPGGTAANPSGRPVIVSNQPQQSDPMMAPRNQPVPLPVQQHPSTAVQPVVTSAPIASSKPAVQQPSPITSAEPLHTLTDEQPVFGHVGKHPKGKKIMTVIAVVVLVAAAAAASYFFLMKQT